MKSSSESAISNIANAIQHGNKRFSYILPVFVLLSVVLGVLIASYLTYERKQLQLSINNDLASIADIKATQIANWNSERREDAIQMFSTPLLQSMASKYIDNPADESLRKQLKQWMQVYFSPADYSWMALLDANGDLVLSVPADRGAPSQLHNEYFHDAMDSQGIVSADLHRDVDDHGRKGSEIFMSMWIPVIDPQKPGDKPSGVWMVQIDPKISLFPLVRSWQVTSKTSESLLVRKNGEYVEFLNDLRHTSNAALNLRFKIEETPRLPASLAVRGKEGVLEGIDYRGKKVLSAIRKVYGTPWYIIVKMDKSEAYASFWQRAILFSLAGLVFILLLSQIAAGYQRKRDRDWLLQQVSLEQEKHRLQENYEMVARHWQTTFDSISDGILLLDKNANILRANKAITDNSRYDAAAIIGRSCWKVMHGTNKPIEDCPLPQVMASKKSATAELQLDGNWVALTIDPILDNDGNIAGTVHIIRDISGQKQAEKALRDSEAIFRELFEHMSNGVSIYEPLDDGSNFVIKDINAAGEKITHSKYEEIVGKQVTDAFPQVVEKGLFAQFMKVNRTGKASSFATYNYIGDELEYWLDNYVLKLESGELIAIYNDITERVKADAANKKLNEDLEQRVVERTAQLAVANKELEAFSYSVSHDLRSPLRGIAGWSTALAEDYSDRLDSQGKMYLERIVNETHRMGQLIEGLLKLSQISKAELCPTQVDLTDIANRIIERLRDEYPERNVAVNIQAGVYAQGDLHLLEIMLTNLIKNAWKFSMKTPNAIIEFGFGVQDGQQVYYVKDNGAGFDMAFAEKLFEAFQRMHKASDFPGTGVGLATVKRIVNRHGGRIWVEAIPDNGATFFFTLEEGKS